MKKVAVVGTVGIPACYGGFESLVENLTNHSTSTIEYIVFCSSKSYENKRTHYNNAELSYLPLSANGAQSVPYDILSLVLCLFKKPDVTLILGVSGCLFLPIYRLFSKSKIVTNIDGLEWKRDKWSPFIKKFLKFSERVAVRFSDVIITDNQAIGDYVENEYQKKSVTIAYGGDHAILKGGGTFVEQDYFLSICRIEPENNVQMILEAFEKTDKKLKFVGNWDSSDFGRKLKEKYSSYSHIDIIDPVYDISELYKLRASCICYLHGHSAGGTNPSLVEAMHFEKPILAFDCSFNRFSTENKAEYFSTASQLIHKITELSAEDLKLISLDMSEVANRRYRWDVINHLYESTYR